MAFFIIIGTLLFILSFIFPFFGLINYMAVLYLRPMETNPYLVGYPIAKIFALVTLIGFFIHYKKQGKTFFNFKQDKILLALLFVIILSFTVGWIPQCLVVLDQMVKNVIVYMLIVGMVTSEKKLKIFLWAVLIASGVLALATVREFMAYNVSSLSNLDVGRLGGFSGAYFGDSGDFAIMMDVVVPYAFFMSIAGRPILFRPLALILMALFITALVATRARGGLIAFGVIMLGIGYFGLKLPKLWHKLISIILVVVAIGGIIAFAPGVFKERAETILDYQTQGTALSRIEYWKIGIKMFLSNPLLGVGAGNYQLRYSDFGGWEHVWPVPHNMYIEVMSELGILGFGCLFFLLFFTFKGSMAVSKILRYKKKTNFFLYSTNQAAILSLLGYCIGGIFLTIFTYPIFYILIAINVAVQNIVDLSIAREKARLV